MSMDPAQYYRGVFREHFGAFWRSLEQRGSCSRARAHQRQDFWGCRLGSPIAGVLDANGGYFSVGDLYLLPDQGLPDHLDEIPKPDQFDFLCALLYTVLTDQVMYAHRRADYPVFRDLAHYPKMDRTVGFARRMMMANPYEIFGCEILDPRGLAARRCLDRFEQWARFIVVDLREFFDWHAAGTTTWAAVREVMLADPDCSWGPYGSILRRHLIEDRSVA